MLLLLKVFGTMRDYLSDANLSACFRAIMELLRRQFTSLSEADVRSTDIAHWHRLVNEVRGRLASPLPRPAPLLCSLLHCLPPA